MGLASILSGVRQPKQNVAFLFPDPGDTLDQLEPPKRDEAFVFQYWPSNITDSDETTYSEKLIPGGSHPLYQWVGGGARTISFEANFTSEIDPENSFALFPDGNGAAGPSQRYTVNVAAAITAIRQYLYPSYSIGDGQTRGGIVKAPKRLILVFPGLNLNRGGVGLTTPPSVGTTGVVGSKPRTVGSDGLPVILRNMSINYESCFPSGRIRNAVVSLTFNEIVQRGDSQGSNIEFIDRNKFKNFASKYDYRYGDYPGTGGG